MYAYVRNNPTSLTDPTGATPVACYLNGSQISCQDLYHQLSVGSAVQCPNNECGGLRAVMGGAGSTEWQQWVPGTQETTTLKDPVTGAVIGTYPGTKYQGYWATVAAVGLEGAELGPWGDLALVTGASAAILLYKNKNAIEKVMQQISVALRHIGYLKDPSQDPKNRPGWRREVRAAVKRGRLWTNRMSPGMWKDAMNALLDQIERAVPEE
jgi:hypothetical protein